MNSSIRSAKTCMSEFFDQVGQDVPENDILALIEECEAVHLEVHGRRMQRYTPRGVFGKGTSKYVAAMCYAEEGRAQVLYPNELREMIKHIRAGDDAKTALDRVRR